MVVPFETSKRQFSGSGLDSDLHPAFRPIHSKRQNYTSRTKGTATAASHSHHEATNFPAWIAFVTWLTSESSVSFVYHPGIHPIPESGQTPVKPIVWVGLTALLVRHTTRCKVFPSRIATEAIAPCGTATGPSRPVNYWKRANAMACLQHARMIARAPSWGAAAVDPTRWRRKALVSLFGALPARVRRQRRRIRFGFVGRYLHTRVRGRRDEVTPTMSHSVGILCIILSRMAAVWPFAKSCRATHNSGSAEEGLPVSSPRRCLLTCCSVGVIYAAMP